MESTQLIGKLIKLIKHKIKKYFINKWLEDDVSLQKQVMAKLSNKLEKHNNKKCEVFNDRNWIRRSHCFIIPTENFYREIHGRTVVPLSERRGSYKAAYLEEIFFHVGAIEHWCEENCFDEWGIENTETEYRFYFIDLDDAAAFKLTWMSK